MLKKLVAGWKERSAELERATRWLSLTGGLTEEAVRRVNARLSTLYRTKESPGVVAMPDLTEVSIVTSGHALRLTIGKRVVHVDRERLRVAYEGKTWDAAFEECGDEELFSLYRLLSVWCPVPLNREGVQFREVTLVDG